MNQSLSDLIRKKNKQAKSSRGRIDWNDRRDKYIAAVDDLYRQVEAVFSQALKKKTVSLQRRPKQLSETYIGTYSIDDLILLIGDEQVRLSPQGRNVAGAAGRVDVLGKVAGLLTDKTVGEGVIRVPLDGNDTPVLDLGQQTAGIGTILGANGGFPHN